MGATNDDKVWVSRLIEGDQEAFCHLYARYRRALYLFALKFIKSEAVAEDICQEVFALIWSNRRFLDVEASFRSYLYTITRNRVLNLIRDSATRQMVDVLVLENAIDAHHHVVEQIAAGELEQLLQKVLVTLSVRQRQVFEMSRYEGLSQREIAAILGVSAATVNEHMDNALKTIQGYLSKYYTAYTVFVLLGQLTCTLATCSAGGLH